MENLETFTKKHVPSTIEIFYGPEQVIDEIDAGHREFCLEILNDMGFKCVSGAVGVGGHEDFKVKLLEREARRDSVSIANGENSNSFFVGPHPDLGMTNAVGIWTAA